MTEFILNGKAYAPGLDFDPAAVTSYEAHVLRFGRAWLSGQAAFELQTSGSTGQPKTIRLTRQQMQRSAGLTGQVLGLRAGDRALVCLSVEYIAGMMMLVRGFELGLDLTVIEPRSDPLADFPPEARFEFTALVPLQLHHILRDSPEKQPTLDRMRAILIGGAPVGPALHAQLQRVTAPIYHTYGMTETATHIALQRLNGPQADGFFRPLPGVITGLDERGCLTVASPVTGGKTLTTNDLVELRPDGSFRWLGRIDNVINSGGVKVQLEKVETALARCLFEQSGPEQSTRRFCVGALPDERLGQAVVAVVEGEPFSAAVEASIRAGLCQALGPYELPKAFFFTAKLLETPTGKIDRRANLANRRLGNDN